MARQNQGKGDNRGNGEAKPNKGGATTLAKAEAKAFANVDAKTDAKDQATKPANTGRRRRPTLLGADLRVSHLAPLAELFPVRAFSMNAPEPPMQESQEAQRETKNNKIHTHAKTTRPCIIHT